MTTLTVLISNFEILTEIEVYDHELTYKVLKLRSKYSPSRTGLGLVRESESTLVDYVEFTNASDIRKLQDPLVNELDKLNILANAADISEEIDRDRLVRDHKEEWTTLLLGVSEGTTSTDPEHLNGTQIDELARRLSVMGYVPPTKDEG